MTTLWTDDEIFRLINTWGDKMIQVLLEGCTRNRHVYKKIASELEEQATKGLGVSVAIKSRS